jgi:hypothetical protein
MRFSRDEWSNHLASPKHRDSTKDNVAVPIFGTQAGINYSKTEAYSA